jgi:DNA-binding transcriptional LysR family regulator
MDLRQLAALTAVADHRSFSAAARALHTVQSNISTHVARLERELGTALVERSTGELTEAGELVVARAVRSRPSWPPSRPMSPPRSARSPATSASG